MRALTIAAVLLPLAACGETKSSDEGLIVEQQERVRTCESIREDIIRLAGERGVIVVQIYEPTPVKIEPKKVSCKGRAVTGSAQETTVYYRAFEDQEGDWMIEYSEAPLDE